MSNYGLKRNPDEKFYTKINIAKTCIAYFIEIIKPSIKSNIIEPSAGNGSFSNVLRKSFKHLTAIDIHKELDYVIQGDYLNYEPDRSKVIHVIGNPPFGRQSSLVKKFIKHSSKYADSISFILPKSFKKDSVKKVFPRSFHLIYEWDLPKNSFYIASTDKNHNVPCIFQIWKRMDTLRPIIEKPLPIFFSFLKYGEDGIDFAIRRVGGKAGQLIEDWKNCNTQTHYYIRLNGIDKKKFINLYNPNAFDSDNTVGPRSISKGELTKVINAIKI